MIERATNPQLRVGLEQHLAETRNHVRRVEEVFQMHGVEPKTVNSPAIDGIIEEADDIAGDVDDKGGPRRRVNCGRAGRGTL
jgi:ferritin-like metal-binding protein YciE